MIFIANGSLTNDIISHDHHSFVHSLIVVVMANLL